MRNNKNSNENTNTNINSNKNGFNIDNRNSERLIIGRDKKGGLIASGLPNRKGKSTIVPAGKIRIKKKKAGRIIISSGIVLIALILILVTAGSIAWNYIFSGFKPDEEEFVFPDRKLTNIPPDLQGLTNILLIGTDARDPETFRGLSDSLMILTINTKDKTLKLTSIMRDSYTYIPDIPGSKIKIKSPNKINAAFAYGGPQLTLRTVNDTFRLDIKHYISVNMNNMAKIVDIAGGITIDLSSAEIKDMNKRLRGNNVIKFPGEHLLNGEQTVQYARIRKADSDIVRTRRQRTVLQLLYQKFRKAGVLEKGQMIQQGLSLINTNMSAKEITSLGLDVLPIMSSEIQQLRLPIEGYYKVSTADGWHMVIDYNRMIPELYKFLYGREFNFDPVPTITYRHGATHTTPTAAPSPDIPEEGSDESNHMDSVSEASLNESGLSNDVSDGEMSESHAPGLTPGGDNSDGFSGSGGNSGFESDIPDPTPGQDPGTSGDDISIPASSTAAITPAINP